MENKDKIVGMILSVILLSACGQSGPLYMPGEAIGVHKKDVFVLGNDQTKPKPSAAQQKDSTQDKTQSDSSAAKTTSANSAALMGASSTTPQN